MESHVVKRLSSCSWSFGWILSMQIRRLEAILVFSSSSSYTWRTAKRKTFRYKLMGGCADPLCSPKSKLRSGSQCDIYLFLPSQPSCAFAPSPFLLVYSLDGFLTDSASNDFDGVDRRQRLHQVQTSSTRRTRFRLRHTHHSPILVRGRYDVQTAGTTRTWRSLCMHGCSGCVKVASRLAGESVGKGSVSGGERSRRGKVRFCLFTLFAKMTLGSWCLWRARSAGYLYLLCNIAS